MSLSKEISAIIECSICTEPLVDPRILPCVHTFCLQCLQSYGKTQRQDEKLACPLCRATFELPSKKFTDLPVNFFIQKLLEVKRITNESHENFCDACSKGENMTTSAVVHCFDCRQNLCGKCYQVHNNLSCLRSHQVVEFGKKTADDLLKVTPSFCDFHRDELVKFFCLDCQATICMSCYVERHSSHKCANIAKISEEFLRDMKEDASKVARHIETCLSEYEKLQVKKDDFLQDIMKKESFVLETMAELHQFLDAYRKQVLAELKSIKELNLKEFETAKNEIQDRLMVMESFKNYTDQVTAKATPSDITRLASTLKQRAAELHALRLDNDFCVFDVDVNLSDLTRLLSQKQKSTVNDIAVYRSRKGVAKPYLSPSALIMTPREELQVILGMTTIKQEMYLLTKRSADKPKVQTIEEEVIIGAHTLRLPLPTTFTFTHVGLYVKQRQQPETRTVATFTQCDAMLCHLQLRHRSASTTAPGKLELRVSSLSLIESEGNVISTAVFDLEQHQFGQFSNQNHNISLQSPNKLYQGGAYSTVLNFQISRTVTSLTVQASISGLYSDSPGCDPCVLSIPIYSTPCSLFSLSVLDIESVEPSPTGITKTLANEILAVTLPNMGTLATNVGTVYSQVNDIKYESVLIHLELNYTESAAAADTLILRLSNLVASESHVSVAPSGLFNIAPYILRKNTVLNQSITFKTSQKLINSGFHGIQVTLQINTSMYSVTLAISEAKFITTQGDFVTEARIDIPTHTRSESLTVKREIRLPSSTDPSDMTSCSYHDCIYIGDRQSSSIMRIEPTGKTSKWSVSDIPSGLSVSPSHNLIVTFSAASKIGEYTTLGVRVRVIQLNGVSCPKLSLQITDDKFLLLTETSPTVGATTHIVLLATLSKQNPDDEGESTDAANRLSEVATASELTLVASNRVRLDEGNSGNGIDISSDEAQEVTKIQLNGPVHALVDQFGCILILTATDSKVHLLGPELNYISEVISLKDYGMTSQSKLYFEGNRGRLYVTSEYSQHFVSFQITEGRLNPSIWRNDIE